jgi:hypothetical protein
MLQVIPRGRTGTGQALSGAPALCAAFGRFAQAMARPKGALVMREHQPTPALQAITHVA